MSEYFYSNHLETGRVCRICLQTGETFKALPMELTAMLQIIVPEMPSIIQTCEYCNYLAAKFARFAHQCHLANQMLSNSSYLQTQLQPYYNLVTTMPVIESFDGVYADILKTEEMSVCGDEPGSVDENDEAGLDDDDEVPLAMINRGVDVECYSAEDPIPFDALDTKVEVEPIKCELPVEHDKDESPPKGKEKSKKGTKRQKRNEKEQNENTSNDRFSSRMVRETDRYLVVKLSRDEVRQQMADRSTSEAYLAAPFKCEQCGKGFNFEDVLRNHMKRHSKTQKKRLKRLTPEERLERKRLAERLRKARIRDDPDLYDLMRQKWREYYLKKKQEDTAMPTNAKTSKKQMQLRIQNRKENNCKRKLPNNSRRKKSGDRFPKPQKLTIEQRLEKRKMCERRRKARIKQNPELYKLLKQKAKEYYQRKRKAGKILPLSAMTPQQQLNRRLTNRKSSKRYYHRKKLAKLQEESSNLDRTNADETADEELQPKIDEKREESILKTPRRKRTIEEIREQKRVAERQRKARIKENPELHARLKQQSKEHYQKKRQSGKILPLSSLSPEEQAIKRLNNRECSKRHYHKKVLAKLAEPVIVCGELCSDDTDPLLD